MENVVEPPEAIIVIQLINVHVPTGNHQMKKKNTREQKQVSQDTTCKTIISYYHRTQQTTIISNYHRTQQIT